MFLRQDERVSTVFFNRSPASKLTAGCRNRVQITQTLL